MRNRCQVVLPLEIGIKIAEDEPVRKMVEICEELDYRLCSEFSVNARFHGKTVHILRSSEPEAVTEPPPMAARSVLDRLA